ncbi:unnamed protein product [Meganyctiphanes norvegica]|uniref:Uncharacterized protein n=1 Tax=Meganyctiphanes norvegica TaxID=48144 RepID=A0AAV2Q600_MEGNR
MPQSVHVKGFSPVCILMCISNVILHLNSFSQPLHCHSFFTSSCDVISCLESLKWSMNADNLLRLVCIIWITKLIPIGEMKSKSVFRIAELHTLEYQVTRCRYVAS